MMWKTPPVSNFTTSGTAYNIYGDENDDCIILIHGLGLSQDIWEPLIGPLSIDYKVISYDLYGHGKSKPFSKPASLTVYANQIAEILDAQKIENSHIVGFSIGGMINRRFAMDYPDRTKSLCILNSPHDRGDDAQAAVEARAKKVVDEGPFATLDDALKRWFTPDYLVTGSGVQQVKEWRNRVDPKNYAEAAWVLANGVRELINPQPAITKPTLVLTCENDTGSNPKMSQDIHGEIDNSVLTIVPRLQHLGLMEEPKIFLKEITTFLNGI